MDGFGKLTWRAKFFIPLSVLVAVLLFFAVQLLYNHYQRNRSFHILHRHIDLIRHFSELLDTIQKERSMTAGYLAHIKRIHFKQALQSQRQRTDQAVQIILALGNDHGQLSRRIIPHLHALRQCSDNATCDYESVIYEYSRIDRLLIDRIARLIDHSDISVITQKLLAFLHLTIFKEYRGIERARGAAVFASKRIDTETLLRFNSAVAAAKANESLFIAYAEPSLRERYRLEVLRSTSFQRTETLRQAIARRDQTVLRQTDPFVWFQAMTRYLDKVQHILVNLESAIQADIRQRLKEEERNFVLITSLTLFALFTFFLMILAFLRLYKEEQKYRTIFEKYIISSVTDRKGRITNVSQAFCDISGYSKEELIGQPHNIVRHPDMPKELFREMWINLKQGKTWSGKIKNRKKDGSFYWVYAHIEPIFDKNGKIEAYIAIRLDITQSEVLQERIRQKEKENKIAYEMMLHQSRLAQMGELLNMIAHQWRQPLNVISLKAGVLRRKLQKGICTPQTVDETLIHISQVTEHLSQTIVSFKNFFKPDKDKKLTTFQTIIDRIRDILNLTMEAKGIAFHTDIKGDKSFVCYENELMQVLLNIIKNAEDAIEERGITGGCIKVTIDDFIIRIEDNAGGIPDDIMPKIFDPYFSTKTQKDGTGLGLYMSKIIVQEHCEGKIFVENTDEGARFTIDLTHLRLSDRCELNGKDTQPSS